jgi:hypothetical protein
MQRYYGALFACAVLLSTAHTPAAAQAVESAAATTPVTADVVVYGGTSGGIVAAIQAREMGKTVVLIEPGSHVGGLTAGGLGATDIGNKAAIGGLSREFYRRVALHYANDAAWVHQARSSYKSGRGSGDSGQEEMWTFEPHVAEQIYLQWLAEADVPLVLGERLTLGEGGVKKQGPRITTLVCESGRRFAGRMFIDATYEGDLLAAAGVSFHLGREAEQTYGESLNGIRVAHALKHQFSHDVDPYVVPGDPASGLLPLISPDPPGRDGDGDGRVQAYNFRMCTTDVPENRRAWPKPAGYEEAEFELLFRNFEAGDRRVPWNPVWMPNYKTDTNNNFAISTDYIGGNVGYIDGSYAERERIIADHRRYQQALMWTLANHPRVPEEVQQHFQRLGLAKDEFVDNDNWPHQLYVREGRRMISDYVMTQADCQWKQRAEDPVGLAAYNMDSHNCQRYATADGMVRNEGDVQVGVKPYPISYRSICPKQSECDNLLVPVCLSSSHIAYGSIRMEPVFMVLGQSAATAAALAIDADSAVQHVPYSRLREKLLADGQALTWAGSGKDPASMKGVVIDNTQATITGNWNSSSSISGFVLYDYLHDDNLGKGEKTITYTARLDQPGDYEIRLWATASGNRATNVPVTVQLPGGDTTLAVDQRKGPVGTGFISLGKFACPADAEITIELSTEGTDGFVVADAVQFILIDQ